MKQIVIVRLANADARNTRYITVIVDAMDGGEAQRKAAEIAAGTHRDCAISVLTVENASPDAVAALEKIHGKSLTEKSPKGTPRPAETRGVRMVKQEKEESNE